MTFELTHDVVNEYLSFEAVAYEFRHRERGYFLISSKGGFVSLSQSSGAISQYILYESECLDFKVELSTGRTGRTLIFCDTDF